MIPRLTTLTDIPPVKTKDQLLEAGTYRELIFAGSFMLDDATALVASNLINAVALLWSRHEHNHDPVRQGSDTIKSIVPL